MFSQNNIRSLNQQHVIAFQFNLKEMSPGDIGLYYGLANTKDLTPATLFLFAQFRLLANTRDLTPTNLFLFVQFRLLSNTNATPMDFDSLDQTLSEPSSSPSPTDVEMRLSEEKEEKIEVDDKLKLSPHYDSYWQDFNQNNYEQGISYTQLFFDEFNLKTYLNHDCKYIFQMGASIGMPIDDFMQKGFKVMAYDYCPESIKILKSKNIPAKQIDLNEINGKQLAYAQDLASDLSTTTNIFAVRILEYLTHEALMLLLLSLIDLVKPGSVFFIIDRYQQSSTDKKYPRNFYASFFDRPDMKVLYHVGTHDNPQRKYKNKNYQRIFEHHPDEILIVRKVL